MNQVTKKGAYPVPYVSSILDCLIDAKYLSSSNFTAFWQILLAKSSREYTSFTVQGLGLYHFKRMPMGLIDRVYGFDLEPYVFCFLNDIIIATSFQEHVRILQLIFERSRKKIAYFVDLILII